MKRIYFIRHAKAKKTANSDFDRKLSKSGKDDAQRLAKFVKKAKIYPDIIFYSSSKRTRKTAKILNKILKSKIVAKDCLYDAKSSNLLTFIKDLNNDLNCVFIIAHNPAITEICEFLSNSIIQEIPTCGIFGLSFEISNFADVDGSQSEIVMFEYPDIDPKNIIYKA